MPLVEFDQFSKIYGQGRAALPLEESGRKTVQALTCISLSISRGESVGIVGESGAGKSTLAAIATGQTFPTKGRFLIEGKERDRSAASRRLLARKVQLIWQDAAGSVDPRLSVEKILAEPLRIHGLIGNKVNQKTVNGTSGRGEDLNARIGGLMAEVGLSAELAGRYPHELSGGELQRLVIARALSLDPELLICDEPASALDVITKLKVADLLMTLQKSRNMALLLIAHDLALVRKIAGELAVMYRGSIVERGATELLTGNPLHPYTRQLFASDPSLGFRNPAAANNRLAGWRTFLPSTPAMTGSLDGRGCFFQRSCDSTSSACSGSHPELVRLEDGRQIACVQAC